MGIEFAAGSKCPACKTENVVLKEVGGLFICDKCSSKRFSTKVKAKIQEAYERQLDSKRREAWRLRMEVARKGVALFDQGKMRESLKMFRDYIAILESRYSVSPGGLHPSLFKSKQEQGEIMLIAGVYWDLSKIYDHMKGHAPDMKMALNKFIEFSMNRPHVILSAEAIRKYLQSKQAVSENDFKNAQALLRKNMTRCFVSTAVFGPVSRETEILQRLRDEFLAHSMVGRAFTASYYRLSPPIARTLLRVKWLQPLARAMLRPIVRISEGLFRS